MTLSESIANGPAVIVMFRGAWCSFCAEQLQTISNLSYDMWFNHDTDVIPISSDSVGNLVEMRDRFDLKLQLYTDPDFEITRQYTGIESHDTRPDNTQAGTFVVDTDGIVRYEQIASSPADRTYGNFLRYFIKRGYEDTYGTTSGNSA